MPTAPPVLAPVPIIVPLTPPQRIAYVYKAKREINGSRVRVIWGRVTRSHGNSGVVKSKFTSNLPARVFGASCRVVSVMSLIFTQSPIPTTTRRSFHSHLHLHLHLHFFPSLAIQNPVGGLFIPTPSPIPISLSTLPFCPTRTSLPLLKPSGWHLFLASAFASTQRVVSIPRPRVTLSPRRVPLIRQMLYPSTI
jgi:hypothetical protein